MPDLTGKQIKLLDYIKSYSRMKGYAPSLKEMADFLGLRAVSTVHQHLESLRLKGYIEKNTTRERNVKTGDSLPQIPKLIRIPLLGEISAGLPIEPIEDPVPVYVSTEMVKAPQGHYALRVRGNSMIEDGIQDGDTVVVRSQNYIDHKGQTVVGVLNGEATLKRFGGITDSGEVILIPRNPNMSPIIGDANSFEVRGIFVGLVRQS